MKRTPEQKLLDPRPGSKIAEARDFGIDLTLVVENMRLTPEQRIRKNQEAAIGIERLREAVARAKRPAK